MAPLAAWFLLPQREAGVPAPSCSLHQQEGGASRKSGLGDSGEAEAPTHPLGSQDETQLWWLH
jgi:hypothetical protein